MCAITLLGTKFHAIIEIILALNKFWVVILVLCFNKNDLVSFEITYKNIY